MAHFKITTPKISDRDIKITIIILLTIAITGIAMDSKYPLGYICSHKEGVQDYVKKRERRKYCELVRLPHP